MRTRLHRFMTPHKLTNEMLAEEAGISVERCVEIRRGEDEDLDFMSAMRIRDACGRLVLQAVSLDDVFGL